MASPDAMRQKLPASTCKSYRLKSYKDIELAIIHKIRGLQPTDVMEGTIDYSIRVAIIGVIAIMLDFVFVTCLNFVAENHVNSLFSTISVAGKKIMLQSGIPATRGHSSSPSEAGCRMV